MNAKEATSAIATALASIAPEADLSTVDPDVPFRAELDLDSFDFLELVQALHTTTGIDIPETDYGRVDTLTHLVDYLSSRAA